METQSDEFRVFNAGNPDEYSVIELFETVAKLAHTSSLVWHFELPGDVPKMRKTCINKISSEHGWLPTTDIETGLKLNIDYFSNKLEI